MSRAANVQRHGRADHVHGVAGDVPAVALAAGNVAQFERIGAVGEVGLILVGLEAADGGLHVGKRRGLFVRFVPDYGGGGRVNVQFALAAGADDRD